MAYSLTPDNMGSLQYTESGWTGSSAPDERGDYYVGTAFGPTLTNIHNTSDSNVWIHTDTANQQSDWLKKFGPGFAKVALTAVGGMYASGAIGGGSAAAGASEGVGVGAADASLASPSGAGYLGASTDLGYGASSVAPTASGEIVSAQAASSYDLASAVGEPVWSPSASSAAASSATPSAWQTFGTAVGMKAVDYLLPSKSSSGLPSQYADAAHPGGKPQPIDYAPKIGPSVGSSAPMMTAQAGMGSLLTIGLIIGLIYIVKKGR